MAYFQLFSDEALWFVGLWSCLPDVLFQVTRDILILGSYLSNNSETGLGLTLNVWVELKILQTQSKASKVVMKFFYTSLSKGYKFSFDSELIPI